MPKKIRDVVIRSPTFNRLRIIDCGTYFAIIAEEKEFNNRWGDTIRIEIKSGRLEQLANDILNYLDKKVKWEQWKPTMTDLEVRLNQLRPRYGIENWFIDWIRATVSMRSKDEIRQAISIYEWLHSNKDWLYEAGEKE